MFSQRTKHPRNRMPIVSKRITAGVFQGSGPCGPSVRATVNRRTPTRRRSSPDQSNRRIADFGRVSTGSDTSGVFPLLAFS